MAYNKIQPPHPKAYLGRGWSFPVQLEQELGQFSQVEYERDVQQAIFIILSTARGERVMRPDFGCGIHELPFDVINTSLVTRIESNVREALARYEARIEVLQVSVDSRDAARGRLEIHLDYRTHQTNQVGNYVYPFYFKEAS